MKRKKEEEKKGDKRRKGKRRKGKKEGGRESGIPPPLGEFNVPTIPDNHV